MKNSLKVIFLVSLLTSGYLFATNPTSATALEITDTGKVRVENQLVHKNNNTYDPLPVGTILMFSGKNWVDNNTIPGWYACTLEANGNIKSINGIDVPNLVDSFVMGTTPEDLDKNSPVRTGGENTITLSVEQLPAHNHSVTITSDGAHSHSYSDTYFPPVQLLREKGAGASVYFNNLTSRTGTTSNAGAHTHSGSTIGDTGNGAVIENRPQYYTVIYIMKVSNQ